jgi:hypothetical protein
VSRAAAAVLPALLAPAEQRARQLTHEIAGTTAAMSAVCAAAAMALLAAAEQRSSELAHEVARAATTAAVATAVLLVAAHKGVHGEALCLSLARVPTEARMLRTPRPPARSVDSPWPGKPLVPSSGVL